MRAGLVKGRQRERGGRLLGTRAAAIARVGRLEGGANRIALAEADPGLPGQFQLPLMLLGRTEPSIKPLTVVSHFYDRVDRAVPVDRYTVNIMTKSPDPIILNRFNGFGMRLTSPKFYTEHDLAYLQGHPTVPGPTGS